MAAAGPLSPGGGSPAGGGMQFRLDLAAWSGGIAAEGSSMTTEVGGLAPLGGGAPASADVSFRLVLGPSRFGRACRAGSMTARGMAVPGSGSFLEPWWCR
jgi:hypothetical protein